MEKHLKKDSLDWCIQERDKHLDAIKQYENGLVKMKASGKIGSLVDVSQSVLDHERIIVAVLNDEIAKMESEWGMHI